MTTTAEPKKKLTRYGNRRSELDNIIKRQKNNKALKELRGDNPMIQPTGPLNPDIIVVGEILPISLPWWEKALASNSLATKRIYYTTLFKHSGPPTRVPTDEDVSRAVSYLYDELLLLQPKVVVPLGQEGVNTFITNDCISNTHGERFDWEDYWVVPVTHPRHCLVWPAEHITLINDLAIVAGAVRKAKS